MNFPQLGIELQLTSLDSLRNFPPALWDKLHVVLGKYSSLHTVRSVHLGNTRKMLHRNFNHVVGVFKTAINM